MSGVDARGFRYALEPLRTRRQWALDAALARVAQAQDALAKCRQAMSTLEADAQSQAAAARQAWSLRGDAAAHALALRYLARQQQELERLRLRLLQLEADLRAARAHAQVCQLSVDVLQKHREQAAGEHRAECIRHAAVQADQDWLARSAVRGLEEGPG